MRSVDGSLGTPTFTTDDALVARQGAVTARQFEPRVSVVMAMATLVNAPSMAATPGAQPDRGV